MSRSRLSLSLSTLDSRSRLSTVDLTSPRPPRLSHLTQPSPTHRHPRLTPAQPSPARTTASSTYLTRPSKRGILLPYPLRMC
ncbi:hypothetical protein BKA80DRAFT_277190 [Phyllosticta citrichinensis]